jgi:hypothetical protein
MMRSPYDLIPLEKLLADGENISLKNEYQVLRNDLDRGVPRFFPPELLIHIKALACEFPAIHQVPISRWSTSDLGREVRQSGVVARSVIVLYGAG